MGMVSTRGFHRETPVDLLKEFTICESLATLTCPYVKAFKLDKPYGELLGDFLVKKDLLTPSSVVLEVGGGYGSLMCGLLSSPHGRLIQKVFMMDLSPALLKKQKEKLKGFPGVASFIQADIHELKGAGGRLDLIIINEVIGDLDTATSLDPSHLPEDISALVSAYGLEIPPAGPFNFNIGAVRLVGTICRLGVPAFISEHSCDPIIPDSMRYLAEGLEPGSFPREIRLYAHSEHTIRFSHLIKVARSFGKTVATGSLIDLLGIEASPAYRFIFLSRACATEEQEIIGEFLDHVREYRWLTIA
ncbi:MAG TPA: class I SAM-dependent methyltransferase [Desulfomonilia bacterium]|nr:class I SAM-dependent methyltransferase [Desulfomonilia bacterium]